MGMVYCEYYQDQDRVECLGQIENYTKKLSER